MKNTERKSRKKRTNASKELLISCMIFELFLLIGRFVFSNMISDSGMGYYAFVFEMYTVIMVVFSWSLTYGVSKTVRNRITKGQIKNTGRVLTSTLIYGAIIGAVICILSIAASGPLSEYVLLQPLNRLSLWVMAPLLMISIFVSAFLGYFEGLGIIVPTLVSRVTGGVLSLVLGFVFGKIFLNYGEKTALLLQSKHHASAYAVIGIFVGLLLSQIIVLVFLLLINRIHGRTVKKQLKDDNSKILDSYPELIKNIYVYGLPFTLTMFALRGVVFVNMMLYAHGNKASDFSAQYGSFYGKYSVLLGLFVCLLCIAIAKPLQAVVHYHKREEHRAAKDIFTGAIHTFSVYGIPIAVLMAVLAKPVTTLLYGEAEGIVFLMQISSSLVFFIPCSLFFVYVKQQLGKESSVLKNVIAAFVLQTVAVFVFINIFKLGIASIVYGYMIMFVILTVANGISLMRYLKCAPDYFRIFVFPLISACIAGLLDMLLARALLEKAGALITTLVCFVFGMIGYFVLLFALKGVSEKELSRMVSGKHLKRLAERFRLI